MAGVDIVLKIRSDIRDALAGVKQVEQGARQADTQVNRLQARMRAVGDLGRTIGTRGRYGLGAVAGTLAGGGTLGEAAFAGLGAVAPELASAELGYQTVQSLVNRVSGFAGQSDIQKRLGQATSVDDAVKILRSGARAKSRSFGVKRGLRSIGDVLTGKPGAVSASHLGGYDEQREIRKAFRVIAQSDPTLAAAMLAQMGNRADLVKILADVTATDTAHKAFLASLKPATVSNVHVYSAFDGLGGRDATGRSVRSVLDARDRNNGRYVNQSTRRG